MPRKYEGYANKGGGGYVCPRYSIRPDDEPVTAIDARDVEPLTRAMQDAAARTVDDKTRDELTAALKAFEDEEGSGG